MYTVRLTLTDLNNATVVIFDSINSGYERQSSKSPIVTTDCQLLSRATDRFVRWL